MADTNPRPRFVDPFAKSTVRLPCPSQLGRRANPSPAAARARMAAAASPGASPCGPRTCPWSEQPLHRRALLTDNRSPIRTQTTSHCAKLCARNAAPRTQRRRPAGKTRLPWPRRSDAPRSPAWPAGRRFDQATPVRLPGDGTQTIRPIFDMWRGRHRWLPRKRVRPKIAKRSMPEMCRDMGVFAPFTEGGCHPQAQVAELSLLGIDGTTLRARPRPAA